MTQSLHDSTATAKGEIPKSVFRTLFAAYRPYRKRILLTLAVGLLSRVLILGNANVIGIWVDSFCGASAAGSTSAAGSSSGGPTVPSALHHCRDIPAAFQNFTNGQYLLVLLALATAGFLGTAFFRVYFSRLSARAISTIYDEVTYRTSRFSMPFFDSQPVGKIVTRFSSDYGNVFRIFGGPLAEFISIIFEVISIIVLASVANWWFLSYIAVIACLYLFVFQKNKMKLRIARRTLSDNRSPSISHFAESTQGASTIRTFRKENIFINRHETLDGAYLSLKQNAVRLIALFGFQMNALTALLLLMAGLASYQLIQLGWMSVGEVGVAFGFIVIAGNSIQMFFEWLSQFEEALIGVDRLDRYLHMPIETGNFLPARSTFATDHPKADADSAEVPPPEKALSIRVEDLWFRYSEKQKWILKGINFHIQAGEKIGIIGKTGSGKSSLIQALFHLYPVERGRILLGEDTVTPLDQATVPLTSYRQWISYISQDPILFRGTLRENIDLLQAHPTEHLISILRLFQLSQFASQLGLNFTIEEKGRNLSMGERQLVCMARCLLQNSPVVIFDEATASIDPHTEEIIAKVAQPFFAGKTQILIAHRLSTLESCNRVLWIDAGELVMVDKPEKIISAFKKMRQLETT